MTGSLVVLAGASGGGKTTIALAIERGHPDFLVFRFDVIGVPSPEVMASFGTGHQPGGAWQRAMTLQWFERIAPLLHAGRSIACYLEFPLGRLAKRFHILSPNEAGSHCSRGRTDLSRRSRRRIWYDRRRDLFQYLDDRLSRSAHRSFLSWPNRRNDLSADRKLRSE